MLFPLFPVSEIRCMLIEINNKVGCQVVDCLFVRWLLKLC